MYDEKTVVEQRKHLVSIYGEDGTSMLEAYFDMIECNVYEDVDEVQLYWKRYENVKQWCAEWLELDEPQIMDYAKQKCVIPLQNNAFICFIG